MDISVNSRFQQGTDDQTTLVIGEAMGTVLLGQGGEDGIESPRLAEEQQSTAMRQTRALADDLMRQVVSDENVIRAFKKVKANGGAPGIDGMPVDELGRWLKVHWSELRSSLLDGTFRPQPVRAWDSPTCDSHGC